MKFSKPIPYNASDKTLGPVSMKLWFFLKNSDERIRLNNASASLVPGSGWEGVVDLTTSFIQDYTTFQIDVARVRTLSLNEYEALVLKKKPIRIKSTLAPQAALPGMGIPVPVGGAPVMDQIDITIPGLPPPALDVKVEPGGTDGSGQLSAIIMATLQFPLKFTDAEIAGAVKGISINVTSGKQSATEGAESIEGTWKKRVITSTVGPTNQSQGPIEVTVSTTVCGVRLQKIVPIEFKPPLRYVLNINPGSLSIKKDKPATFSARVFEEREGGEPVPVVDAVIRVEGDAEYLSLSPAQGTGTLECTVSQVKVSAKKEVTLTVQASVGQNSIPPQKVPVHLETITYGTLNVVFIPAAKNHLNPFIKTDYVVLQARLIPPPGAEPVKAEIDFACESPDGWLDGPREYGISSDPNSPLTGPVSSTARLPSLDDVPAASPGTADTGKTAKFLGRVPTQSAEAEPPASESVKVSARVEGEVVAETAVPVWLEPKPTLKADKETVTFLANAKRERPGRPEAITAVPVTLSVTNPGNEDWEISVEYEKEDLVTCKDQGKLSASQVFLFEVCDPTPPPQPKPGEPLWGQVFGVTTKATMGDLEITGPTISMSILYEGLYPKSLYEYNRDGKGTEVHDLTKGITIHVLDPSEQKAQPEQVNILKQEFVLPYATFEVLEWNGSALEINEKLALEVQRGEDNQVAQRMKGASGKGGHLWNFIFFSLHESQIEVIHQGDIDKNSGKWHVFLFKQIPGKGEVAKGFIRFYVADYYFWASHEETKNWQYELPIHLVLGTANEIKGEEDLNFNLEGARCDKIIEECIPKQYREGLRRDLSNLHGKSAKDLREYAKILHERAYEIWAIEQLDFLITDTAWAVLIPAAQVAKFSGAIAFNALIMTFTAPMGPYAAFMISNFASTIQSESLAIYEYCFDRGQGCELPKCIDEYVQKNWKTFFYDLASGETIDAYYMGQIDVADILNNKWKYAKIVFWLWIWKFQYHLAQDMGTNDGGYWNAFKKATEDIGMVSLNVLVGKFVEVHGNTDLKKLWPDVQAKGYFGGKVIPPGPKKDKADKDKAKQDPIDQEKLKAAKEEAKKKAEKAEQEAKEIEKQTQEKLKEIEKQTQEKLKDIKNQTEERLKEIEKQKQEQIKQIENERQKKLNEIGEQAHKPEVYKETQLTPDEYRKITYKDAPNANVDKLTSGMTKDHLDAAKQIAKDENVDLLIRSTTPHAEKLISSGQADPKPEYVKCKTINELDLKLFPSLKPEDLGKVGYFEPKMPDNIKKGDPGYDKLKERFDQRDQEVKDQADHIKNHQDLDQGTGQKIKVENGVVQKVLPDGTPKDITGDYDVMGVIDRSTGKPVTGDKGERIYNRMKSEMNVQHPWQSQWDYRSESKTVPPGSPEGTQSPYDVKKGIDETILNSHMEGKEKSEPLIKIGGDGNITGAWIAGVEVP